MSFSLSSYVIFDDAMARTLEYCKGVNYGQKDDESLKIMSESLDRIDKMDRKPGHAMAIPHGRKTSYSERKRI